MTFYPGVYGTLSDPMRKARARFIGPLAVVSDSPASGSGAGCALEGSLYNRRELARRLGEEPETDAQTVLARSYERRGEQMLADLRGAFALAAWTDGADQILLAQDQVGVGALVVHWSEHELVFASEVCHLLRLLSHTPAPDETALVRWIGGEDLPDRVTVFTGGAAPGRRPTAIDQLGSAQ